MGIFLDSPTFGGNLWARWGPIFTIELGSNTKKKLTWRSLGRINIFNKDAEHYQFLEDFFLFKPSEHMELGFQKLTWLPNDRSLVGYLASHRLFDTTWLLLIPMLTDFQIFESHCPTRSDFYIFLLGPYPARSRNWYFFTICVRSEHIKCFMVRAVHSADPVRESLTSSVRDDFDIRDYSRQDLFFETGYESELITTINLINSEKGVQKYIFE